MRMTLPTLDGLDFKALIDGLYAAPEQRHAVAVESEDDVAHVRTELEATLERVHGPDAVAGRGVRIAVERDDDEQPCRVWLWRSLVGGQRVGREGFSGKQRSRRT